MKALILRNKELRFEPAYPDPEPERGEALIRVRRAGICATDLELVNGYMDFEGVLGHEFVGVVEKAEPKKHVGRRVVGGINIPCGACEYCRGGLERHCPSRSVLGIAGKDGVFAEYVTLPLANLHTIPESVADEEAVFIEPLAACFEILEQIDLGGGRSVCVLGDGRLGLLAAQVISLVTTNLLVIGRHPGNLAVLEARGVATALATDASPESGSAAAGAVPASDPSAGNPAHAADRFDVVVDCTGSDSGLADAVRMVKPRGTIVLKTTVAGERAFDLNRLVIDEIQLLGSRCGPFQPAIDALAGKKVDVEPLISGSFGLDEGPAAFEFAAKKGVLKVLLSV